MLSKPISYDLNLPGEAPSRYDNHLTRRLSSMKGIFFDQQALARMLAEEDIIMYEVYEMKRPELSGELPNGLSIVHPGKVGDEFFMTKGHFHAVLETGEIYQCLQGEGYMVMETPEGDSCVEELRPGRVLYIPPRWAHRSVNTGQGIDLVTFFVYPGHAGHDYGTIEKQGFRKLVIGIKDRSEDQEHVKIVDNPRWRAPGDHS